MKKQNVKKQDPESIETMFCGFNVTLYPETSTAKIIISKKQTALFNTSALLEKVDTITDYMYAEGFITMPVGKSVTTEFN